MKYIKLLMLSGLLAGGCLSAQALTSIRIGTDPTGPIFLVDGAAYTAPQVFTWPVGSKHIVQFMLSANSIGGTATYQSASFDNIRYTFIGWAENTALLATTSLSTLTISADPTLTSLTAKVTVDYHVQVNFGTSSALATCAGAPSNPMPQSGLVYGIIYVDGACVSSTTDFYYTAGTVHNINAFPYPGWVFYGWNVNGNPTTSFLSTYTANSPAILTPLFSIAKRVNILTNPMGLNVLVDRSTIITPPAGTSTTSGSCTPDFTRLPPAAAPYGFAPLCIGQFDFLPGSKHQLAAPTPQMDQFANYWIFTGYSNGQAQNSTYTADYNTNTPDNLVANFIPGVHASIFTTPTGLKLQIDGKTITSPFNVIWGAGETHQATATAQQTDSHGRVWTFSSWSNGGSADQSITVPASGLALQATYTLLGQAQVTSTPPGLTFTIDGNTCVTPCVLNKGSGSQIQVVIPSSIPSSQTSRLDFTSWSDGNTAASRQVNLTQDTLALSASYQTSYLLTTASNPANSATFKFTPASPDGFYSSGTAVAVTATPNKGYKFTRWEGDLSGQFSPGTVTMNGPQSVIADLTSVPFIAPAGIQTAAGPTPDGSVGPGSIIAIYGQTLAPTFQVGPSNPLAQAIGDVTVDVSGQLLPLLFVSPDQIAAQVPWELADGNYTLKVHSLGQPDVTGTFTVSRDAPAIFTLPNSPADQPLALALHQDGTVVTLASPARRNEQISIYGTGFGPYNHSIPTGFAASPTDALSVVDPVKATIASIDLKPDSVVAATGMVGMTVVKVKITAALPAASTVSLTVTVNGKTSSPVSLPLQ